MELAHVAVYVKDLEAMKSFYQQYLGASVGKRYHNPNTSLTTYFLRFDSGASLELMTRTDMTDSAKGVKQSGYIHIAFKTGSREKVEELTSTLQTAGCVLLSGPRITGDGYYESSLLDPEDNQIELVA